MSYPYYSHHTSQFPNTAGLYPQYYYPSAPQVSRPQVASTSSNTSNSSASFASKRVRFDIPSPPASATAATSFAQQQQQAKYSHQRHAHSKSTPDAMATMAYARPRVVSAPTPRPIRRQSTSGVTLHPYLQHPGHNRPSSIAFNIAYETSNIRVVASSSYTTGTPLSSHDRAQPASQPPTPRITIRAPSLFPWTIDVRPANPTSAALPYVTCGDVFDALYQSFHERLRHAEWNSCDKTAQAEVASYFRKRCRLSKGWEKWEEQQGVRRIDWMREKTLFVGLVPTLEKDVFEIVLTRAA